MEYIKLWFGVPRRHEAFTERAITALLERQDVPMRMVRLILTKTYPGGSIVAEHPIVGQLLESDPEANEVVNYLLENKPLTLAGNPACPVWVLRLIAEREWKPGEPAHGAPLARLRLYVIDYVLETAASAEEEE